MQPVSTSHLARSSTTNRGVTLVPTNPALPLVLLDDSASTDSEGAKSSQSKKTTSTESEEGGKAAKDSSPKSPCATKPSPAKRSKRFATKPSATKWKASEEEGKASGHSDKKVNTGLPLPDSGRIGNGQGRNMPYAIDWALAKLREG